MTVKQQSRKRCTDCGEVFWSDGPEHVKCDRCARPKPARDYHDDDEFPRGYRHPHRRIVDPDEGMWYYDRL